MKKDIIKILEQDPCFCSTMSKQNNSRTADKILALEPFAKLERVREYCESPTYISKERLKIKREILSLISENEKAFDVREWLDKKVEQGKLKTRVINEQLQYLYNNNNIDSTRAVYGVIQVYTTFFTIDGHDGEQAIKYFGPVPTSQYFFERLFSELRIKL